MKRDMDLIRQMLMCLEEGKQGDEICKALPHVDRGGVLYHGYLMVDAGLARGESVQAGYDPNPAFFLRELTWAGHEFLDAARDDGRWDKAKTMLSGVRGFTLSVLKDVLVALIKQQAGL